MQAIERLSLVVIVCSGLFVQATLGSVLFGHNDNRKRADAQLCDDFATTFVEWQSEWRKTASDYNPSYLELFRDVFRDLNVDIYSVDDVRPITCRLIDATSKEEVQSILHVSDEQMSQLTLYLVGDCDSAEEATASWNAFRHIDAGIRRLGYPQWPLTASREDVQQFLDQLDDDVQQLPYVPDYARLQKQYGFKFSQLTGFYLGEQSLDDIIRQFNIADEDAQLETDIYIFRLPYRIAHETEVSGWPQFDSWEKFDKILWSSGVGSLFAADD